MNRPRTFEEILARFPGAKQIGDHWEAPCPLPGHDTPDGHVTLKDASDKALITCHGGRHGYLDFCVAWGYDSLAYSGNGSGPTIYGHKPGPMPLSNGRPCETVKSNVKNDFTGGVTLCEMADAKKLPVDFIRGLGVTDEIYLGFPALRISYFDENGVERGVRHRKAWAGADRFHWRKGDSTSPYGLNRLEDARKAGWLLLVEGESDCWTAWHHGIPALGAPGKSIWPMMWGSYLAGLEVFVWQEPGAADFPARILKSYSEVKVIVAPDGIKDLSDAHIQGHDILTLVDSLRLDAKPATAVKRENDSKELAALQTECAGIIEAADPLKIVEDAIRESGYGGDIIPVLITYLAATSRLLEQRMGSMPVHLLLKGPPSAGKSYTLQTVLRFLPVEAYYVIDAGSPRIIIFNDEDLQHRCLVFSEADSLPAGEDNPAASAIRNLLQDHCLHYEVSVKSKKTGDYTARKVIKPGPTSLITTSVNDLGKQLMSRLFLLEVPDDQRQIECALIAQAKMEIKPGAQITRSDLQSFQKWLQLKAPARVVVPFAELLAERLAVLRQETRITRDFARLLSLIKSVALLRQSSRESDEDGRLIATLDDYAYVRNLVNSMFVDSTTGLTDDIRRLVNTVGALAASDEKPVTYSRVAAHLHLRVEQVRRRVRKCLKNGWLVNSEVKKNHPAALVIGEPMPAEVALPYPDDLADFTQFHIPVKEQSTIDFTVSHTPPLNEKGGDANKSPAHNTPAGITPVPPPVQAAGVPPAGQSEQVKLEQWEIDAGVWLDKDGNPNVGYKGGKSEKDN